MIIGDTIYSTFMNAVSGNALVYYNETSISDLSTPPSTLVPGSGDGLQQNYSRMASSGRAAALLWRHSVDFSAGLALMFTSDIASGFPVNFDTVAYSNVANGDVTLTSTQVLVAWQDNSSSKVKFRRGTYEAKTGLQENSKSTQLLPYPNPVSTLLQLNQQTSTISIFDMSGRLVITEKGNSIDVRELAPGIYFISTENGWGKFLKQ